MGSAAAIGIVKGKPFAPDGRMKKILTRDGHAPYGHRLAVSVRLAGRR
jgi:hypothetical protein